MALFDPRLTRPHLSIPALTASLMGAGQTPQSQPFYAALPPELRDLFLNYARPSGGPTHTAYGSEINRAPAQAILGSSAYQSAAQPQQGQILDLVQAMTAGQGGQGPGLSQALGPAAAPAPGPGSLPGMTTPTAAPPPAPNAGPPPQTAPAPQPPPDPYAAWGGYNNYLLWLYGLDKGAGGGADTSGSGGGAGGSGGPGAGGPGGGGGGAEGGGD